MRSSSNIPTHLQTLFLAEAFYLNGDIFLSDRFDAGRKVSEL